MTSKKNKHAEENTKTKPIKREMHATHTERAEHIQIESFICLHHKICSDLRKALCLKRNQSVAFTASQANE